MTTEKPEKDQANEAQTPMQEKTPEELRKVAGGVPTPLNRFHQDPDMPEVAIDHDA